MTCGEPVVVAWIKTFSGAQKPFQIEACNLEPGHDGEHEFDAEATHDHTD